MIASRIASDVRVSVACAGAALRVQLQYRTSFILQLVANFIGNAVDFFALWALAQRFGLLGGWSLPELALLYGVSFIAFALAGFAAEPLEDVQGAVRSGALDAMLTRPAGLPAQLIGSGFKLSRCGRLVQALAVYGWGCVVLAPRLTIGSHLSMLWGMLGGLCLFAALFTVTGAVSFWTVEGLEVTNCLTYGGSEVAKYPPTIFGRWFRRFFTAVVPLACVTYFPVATALGRDNAMGMPTWFGLVSPLAGIVALLATSLLWRAAVRRYRSTGS